MDLVVLDATNNNNTVIRTYLGDGSGGFSAGPTSSPGVYAYALWTGDFDADGKVDVLYAEDCNPSGCLMGLSYGDGAGHFGSATTVSLPLGGLTIADVDGDGKSDIIMSTESYIGPGQQYLSVFYGSATRALESAHIATTQCTFGRPAVADFNGDHIPDIIFSEDDCSEQAGGNAQVAFMPGQGNRLFGSEQTVVTSRSQDSPGNDTTVLRANNGDTKPDFLFSQGFEQLDNKEYLLMVNETSGTFAACRPPNTPTGFRVCSPASGSTVSSPVKFSFGAAGQVPMRKGEVWVDGAKKAESLYAFSHYAFLDSDLALSSGTHNITLYANGWDNSVQKKSFTITVSGTGGSCSAPTSDGIHVCNPENGSTVSSPVAINATARVSGTIYRFELWLGSTKLASVSNSTVMQTSVNVPSGTHTLNFVAVNTTGTGCGTSKCRQSVSVTVK